MGTTEMNSAEALNLNSYDIITDFYEEQLKRLHNRKKISLLSK